MIHFGDIPSLPGCVVWFGGFQWKEWKLCYASVGARVDGQAGLRKLQLDRQVASSSQEDSEKLQ